MSDGAKWRRARGRRGGHRGCGPRSAPGGFTLLEVVVAITLLGMVLGVALELMAVGLRSAGASSDYTQAVLLAKQKLQEVSLQEIAPQTLTGAAAAYQWSAEITPAGGEAEEISPRLFTLRVRAWRSGGSEARRVELVTYRVGGEPPTITAVNPGGGQPAQPGARDGVDSTRRQGPVR